VSGRSGSPTTLVGVHTEPPSLRQLVTDEDYVTDKRFNVLVGICVVQVLCGFGLAWDASAGQRWIGFLIAALGALQIAVQWWSRRRNSN